MGILTPGNAAVTGFSGAIPPAQIPPGVDPRERTFIDLDGPSARIVDLQNMGGPPDAQLVPAPKPFAVTAAQIGQVFAVALDNSTPPNIYVAATSGYGLPIVAPAADGQPLHVKSGAPNASFMSGLWGGAAPNGGPGSIWKIDGVTGGVSLFANVTLDGASNSGPALGGLAFDPDSNSLFVADRDTGMIHRFAMNGAERGRYDHGVQGRAAQGLAPVPFDPSKRLAITSPKFDSEQPATWAYAPPERLVFGLGVFRGRLYYAVAAGSQIWSVGLSPDGSFANDATREINVPPAAGPTEISKITFDDQGRMFLAERPAPTGAYDFEALTPEGIGRTLRYAIVDSYPGAPRIWQQVPDEYAIGFPLQYRNGNGGVAIGYDYDAVGALDRGSCGGFLWSTGERLRKSADPALAARLRQAGPENVDGLQGNRIELVRPQNVPPLKTYFIDYDDRFDDDAARGHLGDIAIWRVCGPLLRGGWMPPGWMLPSFAAGRLTLVPAAAIEILPARPAEARPAVLPDRRLAGCERPVQSVVPERRHGSGQPGTLRIRFRQYEVRSEQSGQFAMHRRHLARSRAGNTGLRARLAAVQGIGVSGRMVETERAEFRARLRADRKAVGVRPRRAGQPDRQPVPCALSRRRHRLADRPVLSARRGLQRHGSMLPAGLDARSQVRKMRPADLLLPARSDQQGRQHLLSQRTGPEQRYRRLLSVRSDTGSGHGNLQADRLRGASEHAGQWQVLLARRSQAGRSVLELRAGQDAGWPQQLLLRCEQGLHRRQRCQGMLPRRRAQERPVYGRNAHAA